MSLLDNMPHTATAQTRTRTSDDISGITDTFMALFTDRACWQQTASEAEILEFDKRGISVTNKVYFQVRPLVDETHELVVTNPDTGVTNTYEVRSRAEPDAGAGLGRGVYRVMCEYKTTEGPQT